MEASLLEQVVDAVMAGSAYASIQRALVHRIAERELAKGRSFKDAVKSTRTVLHQVGGAYLPQIPPYDAWVTELAGLSTDPRDPDLRAFCRQKMASHASTRERLPSLEEFTTLTMEGVGEIESLLDLACGLNPLTLPWLPLKPGAKVFLCDIYTDMVKFVDAFRIHLGFTGESKVCDLTEHIPTEPVQVALLLKTIPCLEQIQKNIGAQILNTIQAETLVVTFPAYSLGGHSKGMRKTYAAHFAELVEGKPWHIRALEVGSELVYIVRK